MNADLKKIYISRLRRAKFISTLLIRLPFCRAVILNGSMASGKIKHTSDIDLLIIAKSGHIFTCRFFCTALLFILGQKRSPDENKPHRGKICTNYYLTTQFLIIPHNRSEEINRYCAENYSRSILLCGDKKLFDKFIKMNEMWMKKYNVNTSTDFVHRYSQIKVKKKTKNISNMLRSPEGATQSRQGYSLKPKFIEKILNGRFGNRVEQRLKKIQINMINRDPRVKIYPDFIVANDRELRFHPPKKGSSC